MADAGRDQHRVAGRDLQLRAMGTTKLHERPPPSDAEHLVGGGVVVLEGVDAVDPGVAPPVGRANGG